MLEHTFEAGDRNILDITLCPPSTQEDGGTCDCCRSSIPRHQIWCMSYWEALDRTSFKTLCATCARKLAPRRLIVDLTELEGSSASAGEVEALKTLVDEVRTHRDVNGAMSLRSADAVDLAHEMQLPLSELVRRLDDAGVLISS